MFYKPNARIPQWEFDAVRARQNPVDEIRHGPANHGVDAAQVQANALADQAKEAVKREYIYTQSPEERGADLPDIAPPAENREPRRDRGMMHLMANPVKWAENRPAPQSEPTNITHLPPGPSWQYPVRWRNGGGPLQS